MNQVIFVSATPAEYEKEHSKENVVEQIIRPTGLLDPKIEVKPVTNQIDDLIEQDNKLVVRYTGWMTYKGGWFNIPSENQRVKETGIMIFTFEDRKIKELWCENSDAAILFELGALEKNTHKIF